MPSNTEKSIISRYFSNIITGYPGLCRSDPAPGSEFIGAGGLGEPIVTGLALNDTGLILQGALPAAGLAILVELLFELLERLLVKPHMLKGQI